MSFKQAVEMYWLTRLIVTGDFVGGTLGLADGRYVGTTVGPRGVRINRRTLAEGDAAGSDSEEILLDDAPPEGGDCAAVQAALRTHEHINLSSSGMGAVQLHGLLFMQKPLKW